MTTQALSNIYGVAFILVIIALVAWFFSLFMRGDSEDKSSEQLLTEKSPTCAAHEGCKNESVGIVNLSHGFGRAPEWVLACNTAIWEARAGLRQFKTKEQIVAEAENAERNIDKKKKQLAVLRDLTNLRWLDRKQKAKGAGGILRQAKREGRTSKKPRGRSTGGRHAGGWNESSDALLNFKRRLNREDASFMAQFRAKMRDGIPYKFSTVIDPRRTPSQIKSITDAQGARA